MAATKTVSDRIEKQVVLRAPISRVWKAISDAREFGSWFGVHLEGEFVPGVTMTGTFDEGLDEAAILNSVFCTVERIEPETYFSFRWIPYEIDADVDPRNEPTTLVEFLLEPVAEGTKVSIMESGFDRVPAHRRERAFLMNEGGWTAQTENLRKHVEGA